MANVSEICRHFVRPSFPMMTITSSMMMMMSCLADLWVRRWKSNSGLQHSFTLGVCRAGRGAGGRVKSRYASSALFLSLRDPVCFCCSCSSRPMNHTALQGSILHTDYPLATLMLKLVIVFFRVSLKRFFCPPTDRFP